MSREFDHAFLIVKKFEVLYREFAAKPHFTWPFYALPLHGTDASRVSIRYRGLDRDSLSAYYQKPALAAEIRMYELEKLDRCDNAFIFSETDLDEIFAWIEEECPGVYEPVWARVCGSSSRPPLVAIKLGCEPSYFPGGYFSTICDCMCFPRWHGTDKEGTAFLDFFKQLNEYGLFVDPTIAENFLKHYLSFDWTERGDYTITEVWRLP
jgi:hypothetical protein